MTGNKDQLGYDPEKLKMELLCDTGYVYLHPSGGFSCTKEAQIHRKIWEAAIQHYKEELLKVVTLVDAGEPVPEQYLV